MLTIEKIPFQIDFPLKILKNKKVDFENKRERKKIFERNIYYNIYEKTKNPLLEKRNKIFLDLGQEVSKFLKEKYPNIEILTISIFGSALYLNNPRDFDFLVITKGNIFLYEEAKVLIKENKREVKYLVGISIKGTENLSKGFFDIKSNVSLNLQSQIIYRTTISLFRRHIPILGYDLLNNKKTFLRNVYAQISDLLNNTYELYYLNNPSRSTLSKEERARKILSRVYEALSYMEFLEKDIQIKNFRKEIYFHIKKGVTFSESKKILKRMFLLYSKKIDRLNKKFKNKKGILIILSNNKIKDNIKGRLKNYWGCINLPYKLISPILEILSRYRYDEDLAIKKVRKRFPSIANKDNSAYSKKLKDFRKVKVKNLARRIIGDISNGIIADIGGRSEDFVEQILLLKKSIKKAYVTDLCSFTKKSKNPKIDFIIQSSLIKIPFNEKDIDTIILSMILHHLDNKHQKGITKNLISYLKKNGRIIIIEDTYPEKVNFEGYDKITKDFLRFKPHEKKDILSFYDWFGNRLMRNRDNMSMSYNYKTMEEWKKILEKFGVREIKSEFIKANKIHPDIFPPKAIMVFQKK